MSIASDVVLYLQDAQADANTAWRSYTTKDLIGDAPVSRKADDGLSIAVDAQPAIPFIGFGGRKQESRGSFSIYVTGSPDQITRIETISDWIQNMLSGFAGELDFTAPSGYVKTSVLAIFPASSSSNLDDEEGLSEFRLDFDFIVGG